MATEIKSKGIIYCTKEQFDTLMSTGSVVIGGVTHTYEDGWQYAVIDKDYVDLTSDQTIEGSKTFKMNDSAYVKLDYDGSPALYIQYGPQSVIIDKFSITRDGVTYYYPYNAGTLATTGDIKKYYLHTVVADNGGGNMPSFMIEKGYYVSSRPTALTATEFVALSKNEKLELLSRITGSFYSPTRGGYIYSPIFSGTGSGQNINLYYLINQNGTITEFNDIIGSTENLSWDEITYPVKEL